MITSMAVLPVALLTDVLLLAPGLLITEDAVEDVEVSPYDDDNCSAVMSMAAGEGPE